MNPIEASEHLAEYLGGQSEDPCWARLGEAAEGRTASWEGIRRRHM